MRESDTASLRISLERHLTELPVLPSVLVELMSLDRSADGYFEEVLRLVSAEPNFATRVLAAANSASSGSREPVSTVRGALARLGSSGATNMLLALSVACVFVPRDDWEKSLWRHAVQVAIAARILAERLGEPHLPPELAYTCGLLHDVGRFVMFHEAPEQLRAVDEGDWDTPESLVTLEREICGLTHAELGALACRNWGLPDIVAQVVNDHHAPLPDHPEELPDLLATLVRVADVAMFASARPGTPGLEESTDDELKRQVVPKLPACLGLDLRGLRHLLDATARESAITIATLGIG